MGTTLLATFKDTILVFVCKRTMSEMRSCISSISSILIMKISDPYDLLAIILVSSIDFYNVSPIKLILRVEVIVTRWIRNSETCLTVVLGMKRYRVSLTMAIYFIKARQVNMNE